MEMESGDFVIGLATTTAHTKKLLYNVVLGYVSLTILLACFHKKLMIIVISARNA